MGAFTTEVWADSPQFWARLGEASGLPQDMLGVNHAASVAGTPVYGTTGLVSGDPDTAMTFDGTQSEDVTFTDAAEFDLGDTSFAIEVLFKRNGSLGSNQTLMYKGTNGFGVGFEPDDCLGLSVTGANRMCRTVTVINNLATHHAVLNKVAAGSAGAHIILDGVLDFIIDVAGLNMSNTALPMIVGSEAGWAGFDGVLDEIIFYNHPLPLVRAKAHFDALAVVPVPRSTFELNQGISHSRHGLV